MKNKSRSKKHKLQRRRAALLGHCLVGTALAAGLIGVRAADEEKEKDKTPSAEELFEGGGETYNNWIEFSIGGVANSGSNAQAEQNQHIKQGAYGGIEDLHYQANIDKETTLTLDARALFDLNDYKLGLEVRREKVGYLRFDYSEFRTWYNGNGGYYQPGNRWYPLPGSDEALGLDRGEISFEAGLTLEDKPQVAFKYTHRYRNGEKGSTVWGLSHPDFTTVTRGLNASYYDIDESADIFELDVTHKIKATDVGVGLRYETGSTDNTRKMVQWVGEPTERYITDRDGADYDFFSVHAFSETWIKPTLFLSSGFMYSNLDTDNSGSRIYGDDFNVNYTPNALNGLGYYDLGGGGLANEYLMNLNLMTLPHKDVTIVPSIRVLRKDWNADSYGYQTSGNNAASFVTSSSDGDRLDVTERLDVNYTGLTNWVFYTRGEWTQGSGNLNESGGIEQIAPITRETDDERNFQKYSLGARWYPVRRVTIDVGGYYKFNEYDYDNFTSDDSTSNADTSGNRYPSYLVMQNFETYDGYTRLSLRPLPNVTLVTRYEYQYSTINTKPDSASGLGEVESSEMISHIIGQNISWIPWSRLSLQAGVNYVYSETKTPASGYTQALLNSQNNYWTLNLNAGLVVDDRTDLNLGYFYYRADDYENNSDNGVPYGSGAEEHGITAMITRRLTERLRVSLKYGYFHYTDELYGGNNDYDSHLVYTSLHYRF